MAKLRDDINPVTWKRVTKMLRDQAPIEEVGAYLARHDPDFDTSYLVERGYLARFPYSTDLLWMIRDRWYTVKERKIKDRFIALLEEINHEFQPEVLS